MNACPSSAMIVSVLLRLDPPPLSLWPGFLAENQLIFDCDSLGHNLNFNDQFRLLWSFMWFKINYKPLWSPLDTLFRFWEVWAFGQLKSLRNFNKKNRMSHTVHLLTILKFESPYKRPNGLNVSLSELCASSLSQAMFLIKLSSTTIIWTIWKSMATVHSTYCDLSHVMVMSWWHDHTWSF